MSALFALNGCDTTVKMSSFCGPLHAGFFQILCDKERNGKRHLCMGKPYGIELEDELATQAMK